MVAAAMPMDFLLDPLSGRVQSVCGELDDMERVHDRDRIRDRLSGRGLEPSKAVHRHDLDSLTEVLGLLIEPSPEHCLGAPGNHREQPGRTAAIADRCEVDDDRDVLVAQPSVAPDMLINTQDFDPVQTARMLNEQLLPGVEDREGADAMRGKEIWVPRSALPPPSPDEFYWADLEGMRVRNVEGVDFGTVAFVFSTGANDVLVVRDDARERMVPFVRPDYVVAIDMDAGTILVDWDPDF